MKQIRLSRAVAAAAFSALLAARAPLWAQVSAAAPAPGGLSLRDVAALALENDPAVRSSAALAMLVRIQYGLELDRAAPKLTLGLTPFSWDDRRIDVTSGPTPTYIDATTLSLGAGLSYAQALPSAGSLSAGARANLRISDPFGTAGYSLAPQLSASLRQPLFAAGSLIPFRAASAARESASISADQAGLDDLARRNASLRAALEAASRVINLRRALARQEAAVAAAERRAAALDLRRQAGTASEDAALEPALAAQLSRQALVDTRASLRDAERRLAGVLGLRAELAAGGLPLADAIPFIERPAAGDIAANPELLKAELGLRKAVLDAQARSTVDAPSFGASLLAEPRYGDGRTPSADLGSALGDFFSGDGSGVNWNLSLSLDLPLTAGAGRSLRAAADAEQAAIAGAALRQAREAAEDRAAALAERRASMEERMAIQRAVIGLERRKLERVLALGAAGTATRDAAEDARLELAAAEDELYRMELELFVLSLDEAALAGRDLGAVLGLR